MTAKKPKKRCPVTQAIRSIECCRDIHQNWIDYFNGKPAEEKKVDRRPQAEVVGDRKWHRLWVRRYNHVIKTLKASQ